MTIQTTYTQARDGLAKLLDQVTHNREVVVIQRRGEEEVAMIAASELASLIETAYLLRSPANAKRLLSALGRALKDEGEPLTVGALRREVSLE
ncbi:MAG: type II toxin-antitoxin system Phd/YefM family antitoxin [Bellilinea sp.]